MKADGASIAIDESLLESFVEVLPDPCVVVDSSGRVLAVNRAWVDLPRRKETAGSAISAVGIDYLAFFQSSIVDQGLHSALTGIKAVLSGQSEQFEHEYIRPIPYNFRWFRMTVRAWRQLGASALIFHRDITAEKFGNASSQTVEEEFRLLADAAPTMIWMAGPDKQCTFVNRRGLEFTGGRLEDQLGKGWLKLVHPDDRDELLKVNFTAFTQKHEFTHEYRLRHKDGDYRWVRDCGTPRFDSQNRLCGFIGSVWDLSDRKRADREADRAARYIGLVRDVAAVTNSATTMREALQRSVNVICETMGLPIGHALLIDDDEPDLAKPANIVYVKDFERFRSLDKEATPFTWPGVKDLPEEVLRAGKPSIRDILGASSAPDTSPRFKAAVRAGLRTGMQMPVVVDGNVEAILEFASEESLASDQDLLDALTAATERLARFFERRRAQIKFLKQKEELQASAERLFSMAGRLVDSQEDERRRIARDIHDDFTQRLALVSMKIGNLGGRDPESPTAELDAGLEDIRVTIAAVANDLRDLSHHLHPAMLELLGLVRALRTQCEEFQRAHGIETVFETSATDQDASPQVATCLYRVVQEGLSNIAKHSGSTNARVILTRQGNHLEMKIRDEGRGFRPDAEARNGIGLLTIEERVQFLHGAVITNSKPGSGTEIIVQLPALPLVREERLRA